MTRTPPAVRLGLWSLLTALLGTAIAIAATGASPGRTLAAPAAVEDQPTTLQVPPPTPGTPDLDDASDTGPVTAEQRTVTIRPDSDTASSGTITVVPAGPMYAAIDEVVLNTADYVRPSDGANFYVGFSGYDFAATDRIVSVTVIVNPNNSAPANDYPVQIRRADGTKYTIGTVGQNPPGQMSFTRTTRPWDNQPWTEADIDALEIGFQAAGSFNGMYIRRLHAVVDYQTFADRSLLGDTVTAPLATGTYTANSVAHRLAPDMVSTAAQTPSVFWTLSFSGNAGSVSTGIMCNDGSNLFDYPTSSGISHTKAWPVNATRCYVYTWSGAGGSYQVTGGDYTWYDPAGYTSQQSFDNVTSDTTPTFSGSVDASATAVDLYADGNLVGTDTDVTGGPWSITSDALADGVHQMTVRARNVDGASGASPSLAVTIDTVAPAAPAAPAMTAATDTGASPTDLITANTKPAFTGSAAGAVSVLILDDGNPVAGDAAPTSSYLGTVSVPLANGNRSFVARAYDLAGNAADSGGVAGRIDTVAPAPPSIPTLTGVTGTITLDPTPDLEGTAEADSTVTLLEGSTTLGTDVAGDGAWSITSNALTLGSHALAARAADLAGNTSAVGPTRTIQVVDKALQVAAAPTTTVGADTWIVVTTRGASGQPISTYSGTVTVTSDDPGAVFPDGNTYAFAARPSETGTAIRVLFATTGPHTVSVSGPNIVAATSAAITVGTTDLELDAPATVYQNVPFLLNVRPEDAERHLVTSYAARVTFSSTDSTANYGAEVDANRQYTFRCACEDGHDFATRLGTVGIQTITATDQFGNSGQVTINVIAAPSAIPSPFTIHAVQWNHGNVADFYIEPGSYNLPYTVMEIQSRCNATGSELLGVTTPGLTFIGRGQLSTDVIERPDCSNINNWQARAHTLIIADNAGHFWAVGPAEVHLRFSSVPNNSNFTMIDPGDPIDQIQTVSTGRVGSPIQTAPSPADPNKIWKWVPGGNTIRFVAYEHTSIYSLSFRTGIITDFDKGIDPGQQHFEISPGTQSFLVDDIQYACWFGQRSSDGIRFIYRSTNGRRGLVDVGLGTATADGTAWCSSNMGPSPSPNEKPVYHDLFDSARAWAESDPVDPFTGAFLQGVTDFDLGGLSPALSLGRTYNSKAAEDAAAGVVLPPTRFGRGWSSSLDWTLVPTGANGQMTLHANGVRQDFARRSDGTFAAANGSSFTLTQISGGWTVKDRAGNGRRFDSSGRTVAIVDPNGRELTLTYAADGRLDAFTDAAGRTADVTTDTAGRITRVDIPDGRHVAFTYGPTGFLTSSTTLDGRTLTVVTDTRGRVTELRDEGDHVLLANTYDGAGRVIRQVDAIGRTNFLVYDPRSNGPVTRIISPRGGVTTDCFGPRSPQLVARIDAEDGVRRWTYDGLGHPQTATDELGATTRYTYDTFGMPTKVVDPIGRSVAIAYNGTGRMTSLTGPSGLVTTVTYDGVTNLPTTVTATKGANSLVTATYTYDPTTKLPRLIGGPSALGTSELRYDTRGYVNASIDALGNKTTYVTDARGLVTSTVAPLGNAAGGVPAAHETTYTYDDMGRVLTMTDPLDATTTYEYDEFGRLSLETSPLGFETTYVHDRAGQRRSVTRQISANVTATTSYEYDDDGNLDAIVDAEGRRIEIDHDLVGRPILQRDQADNTWTTVYDVAGRVIRLEDPTGRVQRFDYDTVGRVTTSTDAADEGTTFTYTVNDAVETVTDPLDHTTTYGYDWLGRQTSLENAEHEITTFGYDTGSNLTTVTDPRLKVTTFVYDTVRQLTKVRDHTNAETVYTWDANGRLTQRKNARNHSETYEYDAVGRRTRVVDPLGNDWQTVYDADGRIDRTVDAMDRTTEYTFDRLGRLTTVTPATGAPIVRTYDKSDRLESMVDGSGTTTYGYTPQGWLDAVTRGSRTVSYDHDDAGRPTSVTYPGSLGSVSYGYDAAGRPDLITDWAGRTTSFTYDDASRLDTVTRPGSLLSTYTYDAADRVTGIAHTRQGSPVLSLGFGYDDAGNLTSTTDDLGTATYGYDDLNRLISAAYPGGQTYGYGYDAVGNATSVTSPSGNRTFTYDAADRINSVGPVSGPPPTGSSNRTPTTHNNGWTTSQNAFSSNNTYATASPNKSKTTSMRVGTFGFNGTIPANATITAVTVTVEWKVSVANSIATLGSQVYVNNTARGSEFIEPSTPLTDTTRTYTVSGLTRADLLDAVFQVQVRATRGNTNTAFTASLDVVSVQVDYTTPPAGAAPTYDANGNMTSDGTYGNRTHTFDALGRLTGSSGGGTSVIYTLDGDGNRIAETVGSTTTAFDLDVRGDPTVLFDGSRAYLPGAPNAGYQQGGSWFNGLTDQHGSLLGTVTTGGTVSPFARFDPYGGARPGTTLGTGIGWTGEWRDALGLTNLRARAYDPVLGRFIGRDPFGGFLPDPLSGNRYLFGSASPLLATDPSGHFNNHIIMPVRAFISFQVQLLGPVGAAYGALTGIIGYDPIAGVSLSPEERLLQAAPGLFEVGGKLLAKVFGDVAPRMVDELGDASRSFDLPGGPSGLGGAGPAADLATQSASSRSALLNRVREARSLSEAKGIVYATRQMESRGFRLMDVSLGYGGGSGHGIDLVFAKGPDFAVVEAKAGTGLGRLKTYSGIRQGSLAYNMDRLQQYIDRDLPNRAFAEMLYDRAARGDLLSYATFYRGGKVYELPPGWPGVPAVRH